MVACTWSLSVGTWFLAALIQPVGLNRFRLCSVDFGACQPRGAQGDQGQTVASVERHSLPPPTSFTAFGQEYQLPHTVREFLETPSTEMLGYLSGFFAGDGCVRSDLSGLQVSQSVQRAQVLLLYARCPWGSIGGCQSGSGTSFPTLRWPEKRPCSNDVGHWET